LAVRVGLEAVLRHRPTLTESLLPGLNLRAPAKQRRQAAGAKEVALALPAGSALVEFVQIGANSMPGGTTARYLAFVLPAGDGDGVRLVDLGEPALIDQLVAELRARITGGSGWPGKPIRPGTAAHAETLQLGNRLRATVFDPLTEALADRTRLFLTPAGSLTALPFEVLPGGSDRYLIDTHHLSYLTTGRDVLDFGRAVDGPASSSIVAADPDFAAGTAGLPFLEALVGRRLPIYRPDGDGNGPTRFPRLAGTRRCAIAVAGLLQADLLLDRSVQKEQFLAVHSPRILHLATHSLQGTARQPEPWTEALALAGANDGQPAAPDDALLTDIEVAGLHLSASELVVLPSYSAPAADPQLGLRRAFMLAGAQTVVTSLWKVTDWYAKELLLDFYRRLLNGEPRSDALRQAQLALKARYAEHPLYWGGFVCLGDPGSLRSARPKKRKGRQR
jgi:CHAT domain-containing protein